MWAPPVSVGVYAFDPGGSSEPLRPGHDRVITTPTLFMPASVVFGPHDRVVVRGKTYQVDGDTAVWRHPNGRERGNAVTLRRVDG